MNQEQLDRIEQKLNLIIILAGRGQAGSIFGPHYDGWNALSAFEEVLKEKPNYLKPKLST
ncbi:hypothetical protein UNPF46_08490 [Bradyrhizobium sp. UNPF46]|uniref:hypothetical protein n=1 Tax=Bradyrhizobium sp. UNPF46 TaxID=1141168 RepID=UPI00114F5792|nr:hypothetical protein [Bradyrhizobium sp. UNPF46]TQF41149.1 hypothetical protein UNPF46_08490 [Bradyrhizobium sp. UNPF46]